MQPRVARLAAPLAVSRRFESDRERHFRKSSQKGLTMSKNDPHRIGDFDLYVALGILCYALNSPICGGISLAIAGYIIFCSGGRDSGES